MADVKVYHEAPSPASRSRERFGGSEMFTGGKELWSHLVFCSELRVTVRLKYSITVRHE